MRKNNWQFKKLGEVCEVIAGQSPEGRFYNEIGNGVPFYQGKKEFTDKYLGTPIVWTTEITKIAKVNDILMSVRAPVGPVNFTNIECCIGRGLAAIRNNKGFLINEFLFHFLKLNQDKFEHNSGTVFASISKNQICAIEIPVPSIEEQRRIVGVLDEALGAVDESVKNVKQNIANLKELWNTALNQAFTANSHNWEEKKLSEVGLIQTGTTPKTSENKNFGDYVPFVKPGDFYTDGSLNYNNQKLSEFGMNNSRIAKAKSVLMVCIGATIGKTGFTEKDITFNQQINSLTPYKSNSANECSGNIFR